ncbi:DUF302 domain-containing protein [Sulfurimonas sp.]|mgnify:CR=1 FL=1|jgi:uncharacterized protein (DUF302 family)|uniref:DUF302 domain-containing protein n=1 Tax=Sulfurimonas sp. TaxID=2022749 RepID=UPI0025F80EAC|nr:DUF302 domain-containing protein [Sulfurimonas sp.]MBT5935103.1 DUF302 domain-containing protein [Sulfurimonas sp.]
MKKVIVLLLIVLNTYASTFVEIESKYNAQTTVNKISTMIEEKKGFSIFTVFNHQKNATSVDMNLPFSQVIVFGNPKAGTKLMQADILMGYELPMRIMVYEKDGKVIVAYRKTRYLSDNYKIKNSPVLPKMKKMMAYFTSSIKK